MTRRAHKTFIEKIATPRARTGTWGHLKTIKCHEMSCNICHIQICPLSVQLICHHACEGMKAQHSETGPFSSFCIFSLYAKLLQVAFQWRQERPWHLKSLCIHVGVAVCWVMQIFHLFHLWTKARRCQHSSTNCLSTSYIYLSISINLKLSLSMSINIYQFLPSINLYQSQTISINVYQYLSISSIYQSLSISINVYQSLSISINLYQSLSISINVYQSLSISINLYQFLPSINLYQSLSISINLYQSLSIFLSLPLSI